MSRPYAVLENSYKGVLLQIDPVGFNIRAVVDRNPDPAAIVVVNANYFAYSKLKGKTFPIGVMRSGGVNFPCTLTRHERPRLFLRACHHEPSMGRFEPSWDDVDLCIQGGPTLIEGGEIKLRSQEEQFRWDAIRPGAAHTYIGIKDGGKILVGYANPPVKLGEMAELLLKHGAHRGMKLDGGHSAHLTFVPEIGDHDNEAIHLGNAGMLPTSLVFYRRTK